MSRAQTPVAWLPALAGPGRVRNVRTAGCGSENTCCAGTGRPILRYSRRPLSFVAWPSKVEEAVSGIHRPLSSSPHPPRNNGLSDRGTLCQSTLLPAPISAGVHCIGCTLPASDKILFLDWLIPSPPSSPLCVRSSRLVNRVAKLRTRLDHWRPRARPPPAR